jgi:hypothetical protein
MKKQNVNNKLAFNKAAVTELNNNQLFEVKGGSNFDQFPNPLKYIGLITPEMYDAMK